MRISHGTKDPDFVTHNGYGYATQGMLESLHRLGYHVSTNDSSADVEIWFDQPHHWNFSTWAYKIGYHPWESTRLKPGWVDIMNQCDEIWTPSPIVAEWYREDGITAPVYVYQHGIDHIWNPRTRVVGETLNFLHVGTEGARKGGWDVYRAFNAAFPSDPDVRLTLKMINQDWNGFDKLGRVTFLNKKLSFLELQDLFYSHHVYAYPSWGEGFGLTPLQALATGMPTITVPDWAPYRRFTDSELDLRANLVPSPWPEIHPGKMFQPDFDDLVDRMRWVRYNYDDAQEYAISQAPDIHLEYDWDTITKKVFSSLEKRIKSS